MKRIYITGVESSGKTTLAHDLGALMGTPVVPEFSRCYLTFKEGEYQLTDLEVIASVQRSMQSSYLGLGTPAIVCDTGPLVVTIWAEVVFNVGPSYFADYLEIEPDLVFLCKPDFDWVNDPLREGPEGREQLHLLYVDRLKELNWPFFELAGSADDRLQRAINIVRDILPL